MSLALRAIAASLLVALAVAACGGAASPSPSPTPTPEPSQPTSGRVVVTLDVSGETYRIELTEAADIEIAEQLLAGEEAPRIPNGLIVRGEASVNEGYSWHIDPNDIEWADMTIEVCDGRPSFVEDGSLTGDRYCPWSAEVVSIEPLN